MVTPVSTAQVASHSIISDRTAPLVLDFASKIKPVIPTGILNRQIHVIKEAINQTILKIYHWLYGIEKIAAQFKELSPADIVRIARRHAYWIPEFAFLTLWYGEQDKEAKKIGAYWLDRGYLLFTEHEDTKIEEKAEQFPLLEAYADLICLAAETMDQHARIQKACDFLKVATHSTKKDNLHFIVQVVIETLHALFPEGVDRQENALWEDLLILNEMAKSLGTTSESQLFEDYLFLFVFGMLRNQQDDQENALNVLREHILRADTADSKVLLQFFSRKNRLEKTLEVDAIENELSNPRFTSSSLLRKIFQDPFKNQRELAERYARPFSWRDQAGWTLVLYYFEPTGEEKVDPLLMEMEGHGLFNFVYLTDQNTRTAVVFDKEKGIICSFVSDKDFTKNNLLRVFNLQEMTLSALRKGGFVDIADRFEKVSWEKVCKWIETNKGKEPFELSLLYLQELTKLYQLKINLLSPQTKERTVSLTHEIAFLKQTIIGWSEDLWKEKYFNLAGLDLQSYEGEDFLEEIEILIKELSKANLQN